MPTPSRPSLSRPLLLAGLAALLAGCGGGGGGGGSKPLPAVPEITAQPTSVVAVAGQSATLSVTARGQGTLAYQWYKVVNGVRQGVVGATGSSYTLANVTASNVGLYQVLVESSNGNQTFSDVVAVLFDGAPPVITTQPTDRSAVLGGTATFTVNAAGSPNPTYQWRRNGVDIPGATSAVYRINSVSAADASAIYTVVVTNRNGSVTSAPATLTLIGAPAITSQPASVTVNEDAPASFTVGATGGDLSYQWFRNGVQIPRATSATYSIDAANAATAGTYTVRVSNAAGAVVSQAATLTISNQSPTITVQPTPDLQILPAGSTVTYSVTAAGPGTLSYQWYRITAASPTPVAISGATSPTYSFTLSLANEGQYYVVVSNANGSATSAVVRATVETP